RHLLSFPTRRSSDLQIKVLVHPESTVHSMVHYCDGSILAQLGNSDMRIPISHALAYPKRLLNQAPEFDLSQFSQLNFKLPDLQRDRKSTRLNSSHVS